MNNIIKKGYTMKKILLATAFILVLGLGANAQGGKSDGFFGNWDNGVDRDVENPFEIGGINVPSGQAPGDFTGNEPAPLGSGLLILTALGAGYAVSRKRE